MPLLSRFVSFWRNLFHKTQIEQDLDEEARSYIEMLTEEKVKSGKTPEEARRAALIEFGGLDQVKEQVRDGRVGVFVETLWQDLRYAARSLAKSRGFTAVAVLTLALGIGGTTAIFSVIYGALLNPYPYADSDRLAGLVAHNLKNRLDRWARVSPAEFLDYQEQNRVFDQVFGGLHELVLLTGRDAPASWDGFRTTPNMFQTLGMSPVMGRTMTEDDARPGAPPVAVLTYRTWQKTFGGDPGIVGQTLILNGQPTTVIGVMPPRFRFFAGDCWLPAAFSRAENGANTTRFIGRLKPGVTLEEASAEFEVLAKRLAAFYPTTHPPEITFSVKSVAEADVSAASRTTLGLLMGAVGLLLLIACANVANLLLARATTREKEIAIRAALGASRGRVVRHFLIESLLLALGGALLGCLVAWNVLDALVAIIPGYLGIPDEAAIRVNASVLLFTLAVALVSTLLFGLAPGLLSAWGDLQAPLKASGRGSGESSRHHRLRAWLVVSEVALSLVLLSGAGLLMRSFITLQRVKLGYNSEHIYVVEADLGRAGALEHAGNRSTPEKRAQFALDFLRSIRAVPGVMAAALKFPGPLLGSGSGIGTAVQIDGEPVVEELLASFLKVGDRFFETVGIRIVRGRDISEEDLVSRRKVAVVNEAFARRYFGTKNPLGRQVKVGALETWEWAGKDQLKDPWFEIVGVSGDTVASRWLESEDGPRSQADIYTCYTAGGIRFVNVTVRTGRMSMGLEQSLSRAGATLDKEIPLRIRSIDEIHQGLFYGIPRFLTTVLSTFACLGLVLVSVGVFAVLSYAVSRRTQEIGIRMALGAAATDVRWMVMVSGLRWLLIGIGIGVPVSIALARILQNRIWGIKSADPLTLIAVSVLLTIVGLAACYFPARRATKVDPMVALRCE
jgi:putative ABC transport system permease protein